MRRGGLSVWVHLYICMYVCMYNVCRQKTRLFAVLLLENRHEIALYRSASQFIFFERCLQSRKSLLSSAMAMVSNSCTAPRGIEHYGNWVCRPTTSLRERWRKTMQIGSPRVSQELGCGTESRSIPAQSKPTTCWVYRMTVLHAEPFNRLTYSYMDHHCLWATASQTQLSACSKNYKAKGSICVSIFAQWLLWSGSRPAVQTWSRGCQALVRKKHWTRWQQGTTSHGDVEDMELSDTTQVTGDH